MKTPLVSLSACEGRTSYNQSNKIEQTPQSERGKFTVDISIA